jgi:hypothetical protein
MGRSVYADVRSTDLGKGAPRPYVRSAMRDAALDPHRHRVRVRRRDRLLTISEPPSPIPALCM